MSSCPPLNHALKSGYNHTFKAWLYADLMNQCDRLHYAMRESSKTAADLAVACGVTVQAVYNWLKNPHMNLKNEHLFLVADLMRFEARWIATGNGPERPVRDPLEEALIERYRVAGATEQEAIRQVAETLARPYLPKDPERVHGREVKQITQDELQISENPPRLPDEHLHIKTYAAGATKTGQKKAAGGKPAAGE